MSVRGRLLVLKLDGNTVFIKPGITIGDDCSIGNSSVIKSNVPTGVRLGNNITIEEGVRLNNGVVTGNNVTFKAGSVISEGGCDLALGIR